MVMPRASLAQVISLRSLWLNGPILIGNYTNRDSEKSTQPSIELRFNSEDFFPPDKLEPGRMISVVPRPVPDYVAIIRRTPLSPNTECEERVLECDIVYFFF